MELKYKFLFPLLALITMAVVFFGTFTYLKTYQELKSLIYEDAYSNLRTLNQTLEIWIHDRYADITGWAESDLILKSLGHSFVAKAQSKNVSKRLKEICKNSEIYNEIYIAQKDLKIQSASKAVKKDELLPTHYKIIYLEADKKLKHKDDIYQKSFRKDGTLTYIIATRIYQKDTVLNANKKTDKILLASVNIEAINEAIFSKLKIRGTGTAGIFDTTGYSVSSARENITNQLKGETLTKEGQINITEGYEKDGVKKILFYQRITEHPWIIALIIEEKSFTSPAYKMAYQILFIGFAVVSLTGLCSIFLLKWILNPIQNLSKIADNVSKSKNYGLRADIYSNDELGSLARSFNEMLFEVGKRDQQLAQAKQQLEIKTIDLNNALKISEKKQEEAELAYQAKSDFLAKMSHELRTPLNSIMGFTNLIDVEKIDDDQTEIIEIIKKASTSLLEVVDDILDLTQIEEGHFVLETSPTDIINITKDVLDTFKPLGNEKNLSIQFHVENDFPYIMADASRIKRILNNLIGNAIKYTFKGSIDITLAKKQASEDRIKVIWEIKDTGIGISEEKLEHIFDNFTQEDNSIEREYGGTGLGLSITKQLVELMNGHIDVTSEINKGSTFTTTISFDTTTKRPTKRTKDLPIEFNELDDADKKDIGDIKILMVDDHKLNVTFMTKRMSKLGAKNIDIAWDGQEAIDYVTKQKTPYDLILMDYHMPKMNGFEATKQIRQFEKERKTTPSIIIAMTADVLPGTREKCIENGMSDYISKPVDTDYLTALLQRWFIIY